jgi:two-component system, chemotaxis family, CheB/CheR fusion protein
LATLNQTPISAFIKKIKYLTGLLKTQEQVQRQSGDLFSLLVESAKEYAIFSVDPSGYVLSWNVGAERLFGYTEREILNQAADILYTPEDQASGIPQSEREKATSEGECEYERWFVRSDGSRFFVSGVVRPIRDERGQLVGFMKVAHDRTQQKANEAAVSQALFDAQTAHSQAEHAVKMRQKFIAELVHELRTPLTSIKGFASTLLSKDVVLSAEMLEDCIRIIDSEADNLNNLIEQLLDSVQVENGTFSIHPKPETISAIIEGARAQLETITLKHVLKIEIPANLPDVYADSQRIAQVLVNLVGNAAKFSPPNSTIEIRACIHLNQIQVDVVDQGPGIPTEQKEAVFETSVQLATEQFTGKVGLGLGLALSKSIVEAHNGKIWIEEKQECGTTFSFTLRVFVSDSAEGAQSDNEY